MKNIFDKAVSDEMIKRIYSLNAKSKAIWGKMSVDQMLAHCSIPYEYVFEHKHKKPKGLKKWILKMFVKKAVVSEKPYPKNERTGPDFLITTEKDFEKEKMRLISYINKTQELGEEYFDYKESHAFGKLTKKEWSNMFYKHLDHHLRQFGS